MAKTTTMVWAIYGDPEHTLDGEMLTKEIAIEYAQRLQGHRLTDYERAFVPITSKIIRAFVVDDPEIKDRGYILLEHEYLLDEYKGV